jgi:hypothetical protein
MPSVEAARQHNVSAAAFSLAINNKGKRPGHPADDGRGLDQVITKSPRYRAPGVP